MRILIIRLSAIGDVVMASSLAGAIRARYPDAYIAWLTQPEAAGLLDANPALNEVIVWPRDSWGRLWRAGQGRRLAGEMTAFVRKLRARRFDLALDAQGLLKSGVWAWLSKAPVRIGIGGREGSGHLMTQVLSAPKNNPLIASEYRLLAETVDAKTDDWSLRLSLSPQDRASAEKVSAVAGTGGYIVLCPFTTRPQKHWIEDRWRAIAWRVAARWGLSTVILGGPGDQQAGANIAAAGGAENLAGQTSLRQAAAILESARAVIGVDTGLTHMATLLNRPTVALFGSTQPYLDTGRPQSIVLYKGLPCSPCRRRPNCRGEFACMAAILEDDVEEALASVMP